MLDKLTTRLRALFGLDLDFAVSLRREPFNAITDDVFLGARPVSGRVAALDEVGITHVVSCLSEEDRAKVAFLQDTFHTLFIPRRDGMNEDLASCFPAFFDFVRAANEQHARAKILVHCEAGVSRSATLVTALLMHRSRMRFIDAFHQVRGKRAEVLVNIGFASQLQRLELDMHIREPGDQTVSSLARYLREVCMAPVELEILQRFLQQHDYDAVRALQAIFGEEIPRVIQGVRG